MGCYICHTGEFLATVCSPCFNAEKARAEKAEAALDTATRALEKIKERHIPTYPTNFEWMRDIANDHRRTAAAALAQIEGGKK